MKPTPNKRFRRAIILLLLIICGAGLGHYLWESVLWRYLADVPDTRIYYFEQVCEGMTLSEVRDLIGEETHCFIHMQADGSRIFEFVWRARLSSGFNPVVFIVFLRDGKVIECRKPYHH